MIWLQQTNQLKSEYVSNKQYKIGERGEYKAYEGEFTISENETIYATYTLTKRGISKTSAVGTATITNYDDVIPEIGLSTTENAIKFVTKNETIDGEEVEVKTTSSNGVTISANDTGSGLRSVGYKLDSADEVTLPSNTESVSQKGLYTVIAVDKAGNTSTKYFRIVDAPSI